MNKVFLIGDSTVCKFNDITYFYPRYGYGTQLDNYFTGLEFVNIAMSGRSSKSYIKENNYQIYLDNISEGDYLILGFGHNDEKYDDPKRFSSALDDIKTEGSFKYNLYNYYIKYALDHKATPILCTPICRCDVDNNYSSNSGHITKYGDYRKCILELAKELNIEAIDLTTRTIDLYKSIGYSNAISFHAWATSNPFSVDTTHLNIFGAKMVAYLFAEEVKNKKLALSAFINKEIIKPATTELVVNPLYVERVYEEFDPLKYKPLEQFKTDSTEWFGTAFGDVGANPSKLEEAGLFAKKTKEGIYTVGQHLDSGMNKGKVASTEGGAYLFKKISINKNFEASVKAKVIATNNTKQQGFGLMLRDDIYVNQTVSDASINSNYVSAGFYSTDDLTYVGYSKENCVLKNNNTISYLYPVGFEATLYIKRLGQAVETTVIIDGKKYTNSYVDFDFAAIDGKNMYLAMYATRGTAVEFTDISYKETGEAIKA